MLFFLVFIFKKAVLVYLEPNHKLAIEFLKLYMYDLGDFFSIIPHILLKRGIKMAHTKDKPEINRESPTESNLQYIYTNLAIYFGLYILGMKKETVSYIIYLLIGFVGIPVFSGFTGGAGKLLGPTGGYLIGFIPMAVVAGILIDKFDGKVVPSVIGMIIGTAICYALGTIWFCIQADYKVMPALMLCVIPFLPGDAAKIAIAAFFGPQIRRALKRIG